MKIWAFFMFIVNYYYAKDIIASSSISGNPDKFSEA